MPRSRQWLTLQTLDLMRSLLKACESVMRRKPMMSVYLGGWPPALRLRILCRPCTPIKPWQRLLTKPQTLWNTTDTGARPPRLEPNTLGITARPLQQCSWTTAPGIKKLATGHRCQSGSTTCTLKLKIPLASIYAKLSISMTCTF